MSDIATNKVTRTLVEVDTRIEITRETLIKWLRSEGEIPEAIEDHHVMIWVEVPSGNWSGMELPIHDEDAALHVRWTVTSQETETG